MIGQIVQKIPRTWYRCVDGTFSSHNRPGACQNHCGLASGKPVRLVNATSRPQRTQAQAQVKANDIVLIPLAEIFTNPSWFQNRDKAFSLRSVENIVSAVENNVFNWANFDAITVWSYQGKYYILSGHSRTEAFTRLCAMRATAQGRDFCRIPAKIVTGISLDEAKRIAMESNTLSTRESDLERAQYYRRQLATGTPLQEVKAAAARMEGKEAVKVLAFAYLNPNGKTIAGLRALENADQTSRNNLTNIARWIGNARQTVPVLTDRHENELYDWLVTDKAYGTAKGQISNELEFKSRLAAILQKRTTFGKLEDSLNIQGSITKTPTEQTYDGQVSEALQMVNDLGYNIVGYDFLEYTGGPYDRIVMNPPFENAQEIDHVLHAFKLLAPGGRIVSVMSEGPFFRSDKKSEAFRDFVDNYGYSEQLPQGSFLKSRNSTGVNTRIVVIEKPYSANMSGIRRRRIAL